LGILDTSARFDDALIDEFCVPGMVDGFLKLNAPNRGCMQITFADGVQFSSKVKPRARSMIEHLPEVGSSLSSIQASVIESTHHPILSEVGSSPPSIQSIQAPELPVGDILAEDVLGDESMALTPAELGVWQQQFAKSIKADDAITPIHLWDARVWRLKVCPENLGAFRSKFGICPLTSLQKLFLIGWQRRVFRSLMLYLRNEYGLLWYASTSVEFHSDCEAGTECLWRAMGADWWDWSLSSCLFFWCWPKVHQKAARIGYPPYVQSALPAYMCPQPYEKNAAVRQKVTEKLLTVRRKHYITKGTVKSLTSFFSVPKGEKDMRMVYDASKSSLNKSLWAPNFGLPTVETLVKGLDEFGWMGDLDIGAMFLNFCLHPELQPYCRVDIKPYFQEESKSGKTLWEWRARCMMG
jgi:hypothetical protein